MKINSNQIRNSIWIFLVFLMGLALRYSFPTDIEFKYDEAFMFHQSQTRLPASHWPAVGMTSGGGPRNPGLSIWVFIWIARIFSAHNPVELAQAVETLNVLALLGVSLLAVFYFKGKEQKLWLWAACLVAVNPLAILLERKIWAQSVLPFFCFLFLWAWFSRKKNWGAFFWGFLGACLGQIHMSGFFYAAGFAAWTALAEKKSPQKWQFWFLGSALGAFLLIPWIIYMIQQGSHSGDPSILRLFALKFWIFWIADPFALSLSYSLGNAFETYLKYPILFETPTYLVAIAHVIILAIFCVVIFYGFSSLVKNWKEKNYVKNLFFKFESDTELAIKAGMIGFGVFLTLSLAKIHRHYLLVSYPLEWLWLSGLIFKHCKKPTKWLATLFVCHLFLSICFLTYVHEHHGALDGDYGLTYQYQLDHLEKNASH